MNTTPLKRDQNGKIVKSTKNKITSRAELIEQKNKVRDKIITPSVKHGLIMSDVTIDDQVENLVDTLPSRKKYFKNAW